jgi:hypothetical protein
VASAVTSARTAASEFAAIGRKRARCGTSPARVISALTKHKFSSATIEDDKITEYDVIADPARLQQLDLAVLTLNDRDRFRHPRHLPAKTPS